MNPIQHHGSFIREYPDLADLPAWKSTRTMAFAGWHMSLHGAELGAQLKAMAQRILARYVEKDQ